MADYLTPAHRLAEGYGNGGFYHNYGNVPSQVAGFLITTAKVGYDYVVNKAQDYAVDEFKAGAEKTIRGWIRQAGVSTVKSFGHGVARVVSGPLSEATRSGTHKCFKPYKRRRTYRRRFNRRGRWRT